MSIYTPERYIQNDLHVLVCTAFHGPRPFSAAVVRHLDGDKMNNVPSNLKWGTRKENAADAIRHGTVARGSRNGNARLTEEKVLEIRSLYAEGLTQQQIAQRYGVWQPAISRIVRGERWTA